VKINDFDLDDRVMIVAEIGNNHEGDFDVAAELVGKAAECGAHAVKFQTFKTEHYVSSTDANRFNRLKSFELTYDQFTQLAGLARDYGLLFISTPFDLQSADFLRDIVDAFKISSGDNNFYPLIGRVAQTGLPMMISLGACDLAQLRRTVDFTEQRSTGSALEERLALLHCVSSYPVPIAEANLRSISYLKNQTPYTVGYSDHTVGTGAAVIAVALGARIIEKHFTLDHQYSDFRDHQLSADPTEMAELVKRVSEAESMLGSESKEIQTCEGPLITAIRRSVVAGANLPAGHRIQLSDLTWVRPAGQLAPGQEDLLIGRELLRDVAFGEQLSPLDVN
jgi:sialic acid synthase SpsE